MTGLTPDEHEAMDITATLVNLMCHKVIGHGASRDQDVAEFVAKIHDIQHMIMGQAAARAHPMAYRLLGEVIGTETKP